jgi:hypothetical protein
MRLHPKLFFSRRKANSTTDIVIKNLENERTTNNPFMNPGSVE